VPVRKSEHAHHKRERRTCDIPDVERGGSVMYRSNTVMGTWDVVDTSLERHVMVNYDTLY
jgi:hypothetical protein